MRISTQMVFEQGVSNIQRNTAELLRNQDQISTGRRVLAPSDDPVASARALEVLQSQSTNGQLIRNADSANSAIALQDQATSRYTSLLQDVKTLLVTAGNGALTGRDRKDIAAELQGHYEELLGIANTTDGNGLYLFSGYQGTTQPFTESAPGVVAYNGDQGQRLIHVGPSRDVPVSFSGSDVFQRIRTGNGTYETSAGAANTGSGIVSKGEVLDPTAWNTAANSKNFQVVFHVDSSTQTPVTTYDIVDTVNGVSMLTGSPPGAGPYLRTYQSGANIPLSTQAPPDTNPAAFDFGVRFSISGTPADGDTFTIAPSVSQDIFTTLHTVITQLETSTNGTAGNTALANQLNVAMNNIDNALDVSLTTQAAIGAYGKEIDTNKSSAEDLDVQFSQTLSGLRDVDYAKAISDLTFNQVTLQAAQKSFVQVQGLSLFEYL